MFDPIGHVESCFKTKFGTPRQSGLVKSSFGRIKILKSLQPEECLVGLEKFSHLWVIFLFHKNTNHIFRPKIHPPRLAGQSIGTFATRSPHRPNPIGLSVLKIEKVEAPYIYVSGLDLIDQTPVLDIKPYLNYVDSIEEAKSGWVESLADSSPIQVQFTTQAQEILEEWKKDWDQNDLADWRAEGQAKEQAQGQLSGQIQGQTFCGPTNLEDLIIETISLDPRPLLYRETQEGQPNPYKTEHAVYLANGDVHFRFLNKELAEVFKIVYPVTRMGPKRE